MYTNNTAIYGKNVASYPVKIMKVNGNSLEEITELTNVPSGAVMDESLPMAIVDAANDIITSVNTGSIIISAVTSNAHVKGSNTAAIQGGKATLSSTILESSPGDENIEYKLKSTSIDYELVQYLDPVAYADQILSVDFRWCKPGEIQIDTVCLFCTIGTFSVTWNATK
jgi:hypothetical protein